MQDLISRQAAIDVPERFVKDCNPEHFVGHQKFIEYMNNSEIGSFGNWQFASGFNMGLTAAEVAIKNLPSAQPELAQDLPNACTDAISRQAAIEALKKISFSHWFECGEYLSEDTREIEIINSNKAFEAIEALPSAQPERTCVNCGRTANNGGWYADGRTRCPIEEHYALPKDGYCHLWEKRNITDDDYPESEDKE